MCSSIFQVSLKSVLPLWVVENRPSPLLWPLAYTTACTTVQAVIIYELYFARYFLFLRFGISLSTLLTVINSFWSNRIIVMKIVKTFRIFQVDFIVQTSVFL